MSRSWPTQNVSEGHYWPRVTISAQIKITCRCWMWALQDVSCVRSTAHTRFLLAVTATSTLNSELEFEQSFAPCCKQNGSEVNVDFLHVWPALRLLNLIKVKISFIEKRSTLTGHEPQLPVLKLPHTGCQTIHLPSGTSLTLHVREM